MNTKVEKALELHDKGYNCAQAVACSFCEEFGVDQETALEILKMEKLQKQIPIRKQKNLQKNSVKRTEPIIVVI